jgi:hypothetical protein
MSPMMEELIPAAFFMRTQRRAQKFSPGYDAPNQKKGLLKFKDKG